MTPFLLLLWGTLTLLGGIALRLSGVEQGSPRAEKIIYSLGMFLLLGNIALLGRLTQQYFHALS